MNDIGFGRLYEIKQRIQNEKALRAITLQRIRFGSCNNTYCKIYMCLYFNRYTNYRDRLEV